jgi:hypothetical protein
MTEKDKPPSAPNAKPGLAEKRAAALRENLKRRKEQARERKEPSAPDDERS